jgi:hypothetical protein
VIFGIDAIKEPHPLGPPLLRRQGEGEGEKKKRGAEPLLNTPWRNFTEKGWGKRGPGIASSFGKEPALSEANGEIERDFR